MNNFPHGYKPHNGKSEFITDTPVRVLFRNGKQSKQVLPATSWRAKDRKWKSDWDIIGARAEEV